MKLLRAATCMTVIFALGCAARAQDEKKTEARRLESVTWNSMEHKLTWVIATGEKRGKQPFKSISHQTYTIQMDKAVMTFEGQQRKFSPQEAVTVHRILDLISKYAVDSTVWWDAGQGIPLDKDGEPRPDFKTDPEIPKAEPVKHVRPGNRLALLELLPASFQDAQ
ncbi:MAG: hypothetical protein OZ929_09570 [Bryobacterales bacterium]|nr:hypothetical protein [Bryobacterales bacterium]